MGELLRLTHIDLASASRWQARAGLLGFVRGVVSGRLGVDGMTTCRTSASRFGLSSPGPDDAYGRCPLVTPVDDQTRREIEAPILGALGLRRWRRFAGGAPRQRRRPNDTRFRQPSRRAGGPRWLPHVNHDSKGLRMKDETDKSMAAWADREARVRPMSSMHMDFLWREGDPADKVGWEHHSPCDFFNAFDLIRCDDERFIGLARQLGAFRLVLGPADSPIGNRYRECMRRSSEGDQQALRERILIEIKLGCDYIGEYPKAPDSASSECREGDREESKSKAKRFERR